MKTILPKRTLTNPLLLGLVFLFLGTFQLQAQSYDDCNSPSCSANDFRIDSLWLASDITGTPLPEDFCESNQYEPLNVYLFTEFAPVGASRYSLHAYFEITVNNVVIDTVDDCFFYQELIPEGEPILLDSLTWQCGEEVSIQNVYLTWQPNDGNAECGCGIKSKCSYNPDFVEVFAPLGGDFSYEACNDGMDGIDVTFTGIANGGSGAYLYEWDLNDDNLFDDGTNPIVNKVYDYGNTPDSVRLKVTDANDLSVSSIISYQMSFVDSIKIDGSVSCNDGIGAISLLVTGGTPFDGGEYDYEWSNLASTKNISNLTNGSYTITITDSIGCVASKTFVIECCNDSVKAGADTVICSGNDIELTATFSDATNYNSVNWNGPNGFTSGAEDTIFTAATTDYSGEYIVTINYGAGCVTKDTLEVTVFPTPVVDVLADQEECDSYELPELTVGNYYSATM
uniref:hypothetical protein n=1 Tax=uncultured Draconibacterium sp. TaxID=1573823 RepID=UPI00321747C9